MKFCSLAYRCISAFTILLICNFWSSHRKYIYILLRKASTEKSTPDNDDLGPVLDMRLYTVINLSGIFKVAIVTVVKTGPWSVKKPHQSLFLESVSALGVGPRSGRDPRQEKEMGSKNSYFHQTTSQFLLMTFSESRSIDFSGGGGSFNNWNSVY